MTVSLSAFLLQRIREDEADVEWATHTSEYRLSGDARGYPIVSRGRVLAECEARRRIIELHYNGSPETDLNRCSPCDTVGDDPCATLRALVLPYADHPACDPAWLP